jgi:hypothetical protein
MNKVLLTVVAFLALVSVSDANKNNAAVLLETVKPLQLMVTNPISGDSAIRTGCSVFSVQPKFQGWATDGHCVAKPDPEDPTSRIARAKAFFIDGHPAIVVRVDYEHDLALMQVTDGWGVKKGIKLAKQAPKVGDRVETLGFSYALSRPFYFLGYIAVDEFEYTSQGYSWFGTFVNVVSVGGQSGSPVVNEDGRLVGLLHIGFGGTGEADPLTGITSYEALRGFDAGWVFEK